MMQIVFLLTLQSGDVRFAENGGYEAPGDQMGERIRGRRDGCGRDQGGDLCNFSFIFCKSGKFLCQKMADRAATFPLKNGCFEGERGKKSNSAQKGKKRPSFCRFYKKRPYGTRKIVEFSIIMI